MTVWHPGIGKGGWGAQPGVWGQSPQPPEAKGVWWRSSKPPKYFCNFYKKLILAYIFIEKLHAVSAVIMDNAKIFYRQCSLCLRAEAGPN